MKRRALFDRFRSGILVFIIFFISLSGPGSLIYRKIATLLRFQRDYGENWRTEFQRTFGPVSQSYIRIGVLAVGLVACIGLAFWILKLLKTDPASLLGSTKRHFLRHQRYASTPQDGAAFRRKGLVKICFGLPATLAPAFLEFLKPWLFKDGSNEMLLDLFLIIAGYTLVISGCSWSLRAKGWDNAILLIGFVPLVVSFIPFVDLIFEYVLFMWVLTPLVLVTVVFILPDRSGAAAPRPSSRGSKEESHLLGPQTPPSDTQIPKRPSVFAQQKQRQDVIR